MWRKHRSPAAVIRDWRLPKADRRAAREERLAEARMGRERDSQWTAERRAARLEAEARQYSNPWAGGD